MTPGICTTTFANNPFPKARSFDKKLQTFLPLGIKKCALPNQTCIVSKDSYLIVTPVRAIHLFSTHDDGLAYLVSPAQNGVKERILFPGKEELDSLDMFLNVLY